METIFRYQRWKVKLSNNNSNFALTITNKEYYLELELEEKEEKLVFREYFDKVTHLIYGRYDSYNEIVKKEEEDEEMELKRNKLDDKFRLNH